MQYNILTQSHTGQEAQCENCVHVHEIHDHFFPQDGPLFSGKYPDGAHHGRYSASEEICTRSVLCIGLVCGVCRGRHLCKRSCEIGSNGYSH